MTKTYSVDLTSKEKKLKRRSKSKKKSSKKKIIIGFFLILIILASVGFYFYKYISKCEGSGCNPILNPIIATIEPKLVKENGKTNILLVGVDTRETNQGLRNTDTIIIISIDYENNSTLMISIPRDLWVGYTLPNGNTTDSKINSAYAFGESIEEGKGIETLEGVIENIIGEPIHYYAKVTLKGFVEVVDTIGGVDIEIEEYYKDAYPESELPEDYKAQCVPFYHDGKYCLFEFYEGTEHMDGARALIFARSRLLSPRGDFDRARRQQKVINAVKDKILSSETLMNPTKLWDIYTIVQENVETSSFSVNEIRAALNLKDEFDPNNIAQVVLDPDFGNTIGEYIYRPTDNPGMGYYIIARDQTYEPIQTVLDAIWKYPEIYNESPIVSIYNATGVYTFEKDWAADIKEDNSLIQFRDTNRLIQDPENIYKGVSIYKFTEDDKPATEKYLKDYFDVENVVSDSEDGTVAYSGEDFVVVVGNDEAEEQESE